MRGSTSTDQDRRHRAFTLIEVLVVVAVIALLVAILLPSLTKVRHRSKRLVCSAHLSQIGKVWLMYGQDYDGFFPIALEDPGFGNWTLLTKAQRDLFEKGNKYGVRKGEIFYCPYYEPQRGSEPTDDWYNPRTTGGGPLAYNISYAIYAGRQAAANANEAFVSAAESRDVTRPDLPPPVKISEKFLHRRPLLFDETPWYKPGHWTGVSEHHGALHLEGQSRPVGGNSLFGDGHVDWRKFKDLENCDSVNSSDYECSPGMMMPMMPNENFTRYH